MIQSAWEILHADNWCAFALSVIDGCSPEIAWKRLEGVSLEYNRDKNGETAYLLRQAKMSWEDINAYIGSTCSCSVCSKWKKRHGLI